MAETTSDKDLLQSPEQEIADARACVGPYEEAHAATDRLIRVAALLLRQRDEARRKVKPIAAPETKQPAKVWVKCSPGGPPYAAYVPGSDAHRKAAAEDSFGVAHLVPVHGIPETTEESPEAPQ